MIRGFFDPDAPHPIPKVRVAVLLPGRVNWDFVDFTADTGATTTVLNPADAALIGIDSTDPLAAFPGSRAARSIGIGGRSMNAVVRARYVFVHEDNSLQFIDEELWGARLVPEGNDRIASLLGWNILQHFELTVDYRTNKVTLGGASRRGRIRLPRTP